MADFKSTGDWKMDLLHFPALFIAISVVAVPIAVFGTPGGLDTEGGKLKLIVGMLIWALIYDLLRKVMWFKFGFGLVQICGALWANWFQLSDFQKITLERGKIDRLIFICGGIAVLSKGVKDIDEAITDYMKSRGEKLKSRSHVSWKALTPGLPFPATDKPKRR